MNNTLKQSILKTNLLEVGDRILVGLSGGADSVCLCHILWSLQNELQLSIRAIHVHHGIRGAEADRDAEFCKNFCEKFSIPLEIYTCSVPAECAKTKESEETCARRLRYDAFQKFAKANEKIATAHTASDNAETVLFHLARGTGLKGLAGIPQKRGNIIRPILFMEREETEQYCKENGLDFVTDSTNLSKEYTRNFIRMEVLKPLSKVNPSVVQSISRMSDILTEEEKFLSDYTEKALRETENHETLQVNILKSYDKAIALRVILQKLKKTWNLDFTYAHANAVYALLESGKETTVLGKHTVYREGNALCFQEPIKAQESWSISFSLADLDEKNFQTPLGNLKIQKLSTKDLQNFDKDYFPNALDCAKIGTVLELRSRKAGDVYTHPKRKITKTIKKWFNETEIPKNKRNDYPILASQDAVLWAAPFGASLSYVPNLKTKQILLLTMQNGGNTND